MANTNYSDLIDDVLPHLSADPSNPVTEQAIKRTVIEFCNQSWVWQTFPDPISVVANTNLYDLEPESGADIAAVLSVVIDGDPILAKSPAWLNTNVRNWRTEAAPPRYYTQLDTETLILAPLPQSNIKNGMALTIANQPSQRSTGFPSWISNQYFYALVDGSVAKLMLMDKKPWADAQGGVDRRSKFEAAISGARNDAVTALGVAPVRTTSQH